MAAHTPARRSADLTADLCRSTSAAHTPQRHKRLTPRHRRPTTIAWNPFPFAESRPISAGHHMNMHSLLERAKVPRPAALRPDGALSTAHRAAAGAGDVELVTPHHVHLHELEQIPGALLIPLHATHTGYDYSSPPEQAHARMCMCVASLDVAGSETHLTAADHGGPKTALPPHARAVRTHADGRTHATRARLARPSSSYATRHTWPLLCRRRTGPRLHPSSLLSPHATVVPPCRHVAMSPYRRRHRTLLAGGSHGNDLVSGDQMLFKEEFLARGKMSLQVVCPLPSPSRHAREPRGAPHPSMHHAARQNRTPWIHSLAFPTARDASSCACGVDHAGAPPGASRARGSRPRRAFGLPGGGRPRRGQLGERPQAPPGPGAQGEGEARRAGEACPCPTSPRHRCTPPPRQIYRTHAALRIGRERAPSLASRLSPLSLSLSLRR